MGLKIDLLLKGFFDLGTLLSIFSFEHTFFFGDLILYFQDIAFSFIDQPISFFCLVFRDKVGIIYYLGELLPLASLFELLQMKLMVANHTHNPSFSDNYQLIAEAQFVEVDYFLLVAPKIILFEARMF